jgi:hypothetical protein
MGTMSELDMDLEIIREVIGEPEPNDPEVLANVACEAAINALDTLMTLAANDETVHLVEAEKKFVGQILTRAQLVASFLMARHPNLKVVPRG